MNNIVVFRLTVGALFTTLLLIFSTQGWAVAIKENTCKTRWTISATQPFAFGAFYIETGAGTLHMGSTGSVTTSGAITLASSEPTTTLTVLVNNALGAGCGAFPFDLDWSVDPTTTPLDDVGPGIAMPLSNVMVTSSSLGVDAPTPLPLLNRTATTIPFTMTFQADLTASFPQTAGLYTSPAFTLDLIQGGTANPVTTTATATSLIDITITEVWPMDFGTVAGGSGAGTVILDTLGARSPTGSAELIASGPGSAASFQITGNPNTSYMITYSASAELESGAGDQITANNFIDNSLGILPATGTETFQIGATLNLVPQQPAGNYSTATGGGIPYSITVNYN